MLLVLVLVLVKLTITEIIKPSCLLPLRGNMSARAKCIRQPVEKILRNIYSVTI